MIIKSETGVLFPGGASALVKPVKIFNGVLIELVTRK
jgi:hypothetical protein